MSLDNKLLWLRVFCIPTTTFIFTTNTIPLHRNKGRYWPTKASRLPKSYPSGKTDFSAPCPSLFVVLNVTWPNKHVNKVHLPSSCKGRGGPKLCSVASVPSIIDRIYKTIGIGQYYSLVHDRYITLHTKICTCPSSVLIHDADSPYKHHHIPSSLYSNQEECTSV